MDAASPFVTSTLVGASNEAQLEQNAAALNKLEVFMAEGVKVVRLPFRAPRANAYAERWVGTVRREVLDHLPIFGPRQLKRVLEEFIDHYHTARPHQSLSQRTPIRGAQVQSEPDTDRVIRIDRLGGLLHEYARAA
jgi:putative transposase